MNALPEDFDPFGQTPDSMYEFYSDARAQGCPVVHSTAHGGYDMVLSHEAIREAASDWETFSSANGVTLPRFPVRNVAIEHDPPEHTYWRGVFSEILSPGATRRAEAAVRQDAITLIDAIATRGSADLVPELTKIIPGNTICRLLGITEPDRVVLGCRLGVGLAEAVFNPVLAEGAFGAFAEFVLGEVGARRVAPRADFLTRVGTEEINGHRLSDDEIMGLATGFFIAGHETTTSGLSSLFYRLASDPGLRDRLIAEPSLIPRAAEEALRLDSPLHGFFRTATRDVEVAGTKVPAGSEVWLNFAAGNRDPEVFSDPETFSLDRRPNPHVAFGFGIHACVGAPLARLEMRIVTEELLRRLPDLTWAGGAPERRLGGFNISSLTAVPVTFTPVPVTFTPVPAPVPTSPASPVTTVAAPVAVG
jgi:cytochrome P450